MDTPAGSLSTLRLRVFDYLYWAAHCSDVSVFRTRDPVGAEILRHDGLTRKASQAGNRVGGEVCPFIVGCACECAEPHVTSPRKCWAVWNWTKLTVGGP